MKMGFVSGMQYGWSVSDAGDINDDGYSEIIVGTPKYDNGQTDEGGIFIHSGSPNGLFMSADLYTESNHQILSLAQASLRWEM